MSPALTLHFAHRPSALAYMASALLPSPGLGPGRRVPALRARWTGHLAQPREVAELLRLTGLPVTEYLPPLYFHVFTFPLQMALLTHRAFPHPIWRALQVRSHLLQHRPVPVEAVCDFETRVAGQRVLDKGAEADLHTVVHWQGARVWEGLTTFYYRGRFGAPEPASTLARAPHPGSERVASWQGLGRGSWAFGRFSGDFNGIHFWSPYARLFGFRGAFHHPQVMLGQALAHLPQPDRSGAWRLDAWLKGPLYYGTEVSLRASPERDGTVFALFAEGEQRPAILGRWSACAAEARLIDERGDAEGACPEQSEG
ncbi:MAG: hypothetical protein ACHQZQ_07015 [SAR324 cluster bacterium]